MPLTKRERVALFLQALEQAPNAENESAAYDLLCNTLNAIEDQYSGVPYNPATEATDGRMYPPLADSIRKQGTIPGIKTRYRSRGHFSTTQHNGAIRIETPDGTIHLDKPGADGLKLDETNKSK